MDVLLTVGGGITAVAFGKSVGRLFVVPTRERLVRDSVPPHPEMDVSFVPVRYVSATDVTRLDGSASFNLTVDEEEDKVVTGTVSFFLDTVLVRLRLSSILGLRDDLE